MRWLLLGLAIGSASAAAADGCSARPIRLISGDRLTLQCADGRRLQVGLAGVVAEAANRRWGAAARRQLGALVMGRVVRVELRPAGDPRRPLAILRLGDSAVNLRLLQSGTVRYRPDGLTDTERLVYQRAQRQAHDRRIGLWRELSLAPRKPAIRVPGGPLPDL